MRFLPFYYGWVILVALAITEMLALGSTAYAAGLFVLPLQREFGLSRFSANLAFPILFIGVSVLAPLVGKFLDRYPAKWVLIVGGLSFCVGFAIIALSDALWVMVLALVVPAALGFAAIGTLTTGTLLARWFYKRRGLALGIGAVATSGGGILVVPALSALIEAYGWRTALLVEGVVIAVASIIVALVFIHDRPSDLGLENHSENKGRPPGDVVAASQDSRWHWKTILRTPTFWGVAVGLAVVSGVSQALVTTLVPYASQLGIAAPATARLVTLFAFAAGITKILGGLLTDVINRRVILFCSGIIMMMAAGIELVSPSYAGLAATTILAGISLGCMLPSSAAVIALVFGAPSFGRVMGLAYVLLGFAVICLPPLAGMLFDRTGGYGAGFTLFVVLSCIGAISALLVPRRIL